MTRLEEIRERWEKATPGPWEVDGEAPWVIVSPAPAGEDDYGVIVADIPTYGPDHIPVVPEDAAAIACAREDVPWLLAEVERLTKSVGAFSSARDTAKKGWQRLKDRLADPWDLEGNAAAMAWKKRVDAVQAWAEQEYGDATAFPTGLVFALFGSVAAELHEEKTDART